MASNIVQLSTLFCVTLCYFSGVFPTNLASAAVTTCADSPCYLPQQCTEDPGQNATCMCGVHYTGDRCDVVQLNYIPSWNITTENVTFTWKKPIDLQNYTAALYEKYVNKPEQTLEYYNISSGNHTKMTFGGLKYGTTYVICIVTSDEVQRVEGDDLFSVTFSKNRDCCFSFKTSYHGRSPETIAAIVIGITVGSLTGMVLLIGVIRACITNKKIEEKEKLCDDDKRSEKSPSRTSSKRGSKRSIRPRSGSVKKTAWKYEGSTPIGGPVGSRDNLDKPNMGECDSVASVASISVTVLDESTGQPLEVGLGHGDEDDQALPT